MEILAFDDLATVIRQRLADDERFVVTAPVRLRDKDTGRFRDHDIVIAFRHGGSEWLTALGRHDRARRVGAAALDVFYKKCERTGVHRGIVISEQGFTAEGLSRATQLGLGCMSLEAALGFDWRQTQIVKRRARVITSIKAVVTTDPPFSGRVNVCDLEDRPIDRARLHGFVVACLDASSPADARAPGAFRERLHQDAPDLAAMTPEGARLKVSRVDVEVEYRIAEAEGGGRGAEHAASAAGADDTEGVLSFVRGADGRLTMSLGAREKER